jgi:hypothetical protein
VPVYARFCACVVDSVPVYDLTKDQFSVPFNHE